MAETHPGGGGGGGVGGWGGEATLKTLTPSVKELGGWPEQQPLKTRKHKCFLEFFGRKPPSTFFAVKTCKKKKHLFRRVFGPETGF